MSTDRITLDTNILIYAVDRDAGTRHQKAMAIVDDAVEQDCVLILQALSEFFSGATRKGKMPIGDAREQIRDWQILFPTILPKATTLNIAINAVDNHRLSFWDAMLWAAAKQAGVTILMSEDFQHGRELEGVHFYNPFL
ncbi:MAG: PIN domain-containing protein [Gammaproteobacteria bacterium]|nr:PIN domain-containing protein [Gammaproteobacteria bacterium]